MSAVNEHVFSHGDAGHAGDLRALERPPLVGPPRLAGAQRRDRADAARGGLVRGRPADPGHHSDQPAGPDRTVHPRRPAADPLAQLARPRPACDRLHRGLHRRRLDAARGRAAHRPLAMDPRQGGRAGDPLRLRGHRLLALHPDSLPRVPGIDDRLPAADLPLRPDPQRPPACAAGADRALPAPRRLADRQPPRRVEPAPRRHLRHGPAGGPALVIAATIEVYVWPHILEALSAGLRTNMLGG